MLSRNWNYLFLFKRCVCVCVCVCVKLDHIPFIGILQSPIWELCLPTSYHQLCWRKMLHGYLHRFVVNSRRRQWHPLQCSRLENPMDGGAWWAAVHGVAKSQNDWATSLSLFTFLHWRRKWQPTPVFLPGESQGRGSLVGCHLWGRTESDMTETT